MSQVLGLSKNQKIFQKSSKNLKILQKSENLSKIWKSSKNLKIFPKKICLNLFYMIFRGTGAGQHYFVAFLSLLSPQARGASVMYLLFQHVLKGICDEFKAIWELRLRSFQAIFTCQGHINKIFPVSECLKLFFRKFFWFSEIFRFTENFQIFGKFSDFWKIFRFWEKFQILGKFSDFGKIFRFSKKNQIFRKFSDFGKIFSHVMSPHHSDQMSQWSQVSRIALCMAKVNVTQAMSDSVSQWVSDKVTYWAVLDS